MTFINCPECDAVISSKATSCPHCGAPVLPESSYASAKASGSNQGQGVPPKTWLIESILVTLFCCLPFGIVGIIYATQVESNWYAGRRELSASSSRSAKTWTLVSFWVGLSGVLVYMLLVIFGVLAGFWGSFLSEAF